MEAQARHRPAPPGGLGLSDEGMDVGSDEWGMSILAKLGLELGDRDLWRVAASEGRGPLFAWWLKERAWATA